LHINFNDSSQGTTTVNYRYDISCVPGNTIVQDPTGYTVCPSSSKKDIYVELDWMTGQDASSQAIQDVVKAFDKRGIALHIQLGENPSTSGTGDIGKHYCDIQPITLRNIGSSGAACSKTTTNYQSYPWLKQNFFGTIDERNGVTTFCPSNQIPTNAGTVSNANSFNCLTAKRQVFHYTMLVNYQSANIGSPGWSEILGNDFIVSLGNFTNGVGNIDEQEASIMHEFGHNFGLHHGGLPPPTGVEADDNCKPNYLSVMSYTYEFRKTADTCRPLDYSDNALANLNEANTSPTLSDSNIGSYSYPTDNPHPPDNPGQVCPTSGPRPIWWSSPSGVKSDFAGNTIDWNQASPPPTTYSQNLNNLPSIGCGNPTLSMLNGFNDWNYITNGDSNISTPLNFTSWPNFYTANVVADQSDDVGQGITHTEVPFSGTLGPIDTSPPIFTVPENLVIISITGSPMSVNYHTPTATDDVRVTEGPTCNPSSGSTFQIGTTPVTCTAKDAAGNTGTATFTVTVNTPPPNNWWIYALTAAIIIIVTIIGLWTSRR